jgi:molybdopterin converting factor small subunit
MWWRWVIVADASPTIRVTLKLFASLGRYLPAEARENQVVLEAAEDASPAAVLALVGLPHHLSHLALLNGDYLALADLERVSLTEGDVLAIWPPVAGG